jgi:hypothetical protein
MKLATFTHERRTRIGLVVEQSIIDLAAAEPGLPTDMKQFLKPATKRGHAHETLSVAQRRVYRSQR